MVSLQESINNLNLAKEEHTKLMIDVQTGLIERMHQDKHQWIQSNQPFRVHSLEDLETKLQLKYFNIKQLFVPFILFR